MTPEIQDELWRICAGTFLSEFPDDLTMEEMREILEAGDEHPRAVELTIWEPFDGRSLRSVGKCIECLYRSLVESPKIQIIARL